MLRVLDLFSGIGGFSLGLERTGGFKTVAFCEIEPFPRKVLAKHWPEVPCYHDIRELSADRLAADGIAIDVVCGGFPCQPYSTASAGKRCGADDDRALWPEMFRIVSETHPNWVLCENVVGFESMALRQVVSDLDASGFSVALFEIPACAVGFDHRRSRIWICAHAHRNGESKLPFDAEMARGKRPGPIARGNRKTNGFPSRVDRLRALGNAVVPQIPELIGRAILAAELGYADLKVA